MELMQVMFPILSQAPAAQAPSIGWTDLGAILPVLILFGTGAAVLGIDLFLPGETAKDGPPGKPILHFLSLLGAAVAGAQVCGALAAHDGVPRSYFLEAIRVDRFSLAMSLLIIIGAGFSLLAAADALRARGLELGEFHALILLASGSMILFAQSSSLIMLFLSLETLSMAVYVLTAFTRDEKRSVEGALKYFVLGGLSTGFLLFGLTLIYGATRSANLAEIASVLQGASGPVDRPLLLAGAGLAMVGLAFKIGAFPFHSWLPDAYEGAPSVVTGFMAVTVKVASFAVLLRIGTLLAATGAPGLGDAGIRGGLVAVLSALAVLTMVFGNVVAVVQSSVKRMLAYSAMAHTGYLLVGVVAALEAQAARGAPPAPGGAPAEIPGGGAGAAVIFYLFPYALMTLGAFTCLSHLGRGGADRESFAEFRGLSRSHPLLALGILILMASFAGIPPTAGFWGKLYIFREAIETGHWGLALAGIVMSVVSVYYYLGLVVAMYMQPAEDAPPLDLEPRTPGRLALTLAVGAVVLVGLFPDVFFRLSAECGLR